MVNYNKPVVAIFGGSFDPPHKGHQEIVRVALSSLDIDKLHIVPAFLNPFKSSNLASSQTRLKWIKTLFSNIDNVIIETYEIDQGKSTTTFDTVKHINKMNIVKYLIIGADNLNSISKWSNFEWLNEHVTWVIASRDGYNLDTNVLKNWKLLDVDMKISATKIRKTKDLQLVDNKIKESVKKVIENDN